MWLNNDGLLDIYLQYGVIWFDRFFVYQLDVNNQLVVLSGLSSYILVDGFIVCFDIKEYDIIVLLFV